MNKLMLSLFLFCGLIPISNAQNIGIGSSSPIGKVQINHRAAESSPTLNLIDSTTDSEAILQFKHLGSVNSWQIRGLAHTTTPSSASLIYVYRSSASLSTQLMTLTGAGNLGVGDPIPSHRLSVGGSVRLTGELNRPSTGGTNLLPIAYGNIAFNGGINTGSGNFTVTKLTTGWYGITITGESYQFQSYTALVTPVGSSVPILVSTGSGSGDLHVHTWNASGTATDTNFCFVVYKH